MMSLLKKQRRFTEAEAVRYLLQIVDAVEYMHRNRVLHRDLKLGNLFLNKDMDIKIGDFGLATTVAEGERKRSVLPHLRFPLRIPPLMFPLVPSQNHVWHPQLHCPGNPDKRERPQLRG